MRSFLKKKTEESFKKVSAYRQTEAGRCWECLFESIIEMLKEDLVTAKPEKAVEIQGAIKELRQILKAVKGSSIE